MHRAIIEKDGHLFVSVTTVNGLIQDENLIRWRGDVGNDFADERMQIGRDKGNRGHDLLQLVNDGKDYKIDDKELEPWEKECIDGYKNWLGTYVDEIHLVEKQLFSVHFGVHGKPDFVFRLKGDDHYSIGDFKFGNYIDKKKIAMQLSGYDMLCECNGIKVKNWFYFHLNKGWKLPEIIAQSEHASAKNAFLQLKNVFIYFKT